MSSSIMRRTRRTAEIEERRTRAAGPERPTDGLSLSVGQPTHGQSLRGVRLEATKRVSDFFLVLCQSYPCPTDAEAHSPSGHTPTS